MPESTFIPVVAAKIRESVFFLLVAGGFGTLPFDSFSQDPVFVFEDTLNDQSFLQVTSFNHYSSNRFNNALMDRFLFGGNITPEIKDDNEARLKTLNSFGGEFEQRIDSYSPDINPFKKEKYGLKLSFADQHFISGNIAPDFYRVALYGNANYIGDTMDLSYTHFQYQHYLRFSFGFYDKRTLSGVQLSYISGSKAFNYHSAGSELISHADGDTVELHVAGEGFSTADLSPYWAFQGNGFSIDLNYNFLFYSKEGNRQVVNFRINNLGVIFWNRNTSSWFVDSSTVYNGFDAQRFLDKDSLNDEYNFEDTLGIIKSVGYYTDVLPLELVVEKLADRYSTNKLQFIFGFKAILTPDYRPYLYVGGYYQPVSKFSLATHVSYGGFAGIRWGLNLHYWPTGNLYFSLGTVDMIGNISKNFGFGRSANFTANFKL